MRVEKPKEKYDQLIADGYCVIKDVLKEEMLVRLRTVTDELFDAQTEDERRTVITLWYHPFFALLPTGMQAHIGRLRQSLAWSEADWARIAELAPVCKSDVEPLKWNRNPGPELK